MTLFARRRVRLIAALAATAGAASVGVACGGHDGVNATPASQDHPRPQTYGRQALESEAHRVIDVKTSDDLRFDPPQARVAPGETITFHIVNAGRQEHEFMIGGPDAQELHEDQMASMKMDGMAGMDMSSPGHVKYMRSLAKRIATLDRIAAANAGVHIPPGEQRDLTWAFTGAQMPVYGCHLPGHWSAGMKGTFLIGGSP